MLLSNQSGNIIPVWAEAGKNEKIQYKIIANKKVYLKCGLGIRAGNSGHLNSGLSWMPSRFKTLSFGFSFLVIINIALAQCDECNIIYIRLV